jgi:hypothetical protein
MRRSRLFSRPTSTPSYFGGVFPLLRYDNLASAVRKILRGYRREETVRFMAFRSHWRFAAEFRTPGEGHEKGGIEGEGGYFRRNHWVPVPHVADLDALNIMLVAACRADEARVLTGRSETIGAAMAVERDHLLSCPAEGLDLAEIMFPLVDKQGCVTVKTNFYSAPIRAGTRVEARIHPLHVEIWHAGRLIARHERCHSRRQHVLDLEHYLDVLSHKPAAFAGSKPLAQWRGGSLAGLLRRALDPSARAARQAEWHSRHGGCAGVGPRVWPRAAAHGGCRHGIAWRLRRRGGAVSADRGRPAQDAAGSSRCRNLGLLRPAAAGSR